MIKTINLDHNSVVTTFTSQIWTILLVCNNIAQYQQALQTNNVLLIDVKGYILYGLLSYMVVQQDYNFPNGHQVTCVDCHMHRSFHICTEWTVCPGQQGTALKETATQWHKLVPMA